MTVVAGKVAVLVRRFPKLSETFILGEIASLVDAGIDIRIVSLHRPAESLQQPDAERFSNRVTYLDRTPGLRGVLKSFRYMFRWGSHLHALFRQLRGSGAHFSQLCSLHEICDKHDIRHIHAHYISEPALLADFVSRVRGHSFSVSAHAKDIYLTDTAAIRERLRNAAFVTTCTAHNKKFLLQHAGDASSRVHLLYHGIDHERFRPANPLPERSTPLLVAVGRYKRKKGFDLLIAACARLVSDGIPLRCDIVGYGDQEHQLRKMIIDSGLNNHIRLMAPVSHHDLVGILQGATVCVLPCRQTEDGDRDGIPNAMLEAMSCEIPVVTTAVSGIPEVVESGTNGLLVAPEDVHALVGAIRTVLGDTLLRRKLAAGGRRTVKDMFCWDTNISVLGELLGTAVANSASGSNA